MIVARVNDNFDAHVPLELLHNGTSHSVRFVVDTGFNGFLSVTTDLLRLLNVEWLSNSRNLEAGFGDYDFKTKHSMSETMPKYRKSWRENHGPSQCGEVPA